MNPPRREHNFEIANINELQPGAPRTLRVSVLLGNSKSGTQLGGTKEYVVEVTTSYSDGIGEEVQSDDAYFCVPESKINVKGTVSLYPCEVHFDEKSFGVTDSGSTRP